MPVALPELGALHISHGARGIGHTGARKFVAQLLAPLAGRLDVSRFAVAGWSMGGGGCLLAALADPSLKCVIAFAPQ